MKVLIAVVAVILAIAAVGVILVAAAGVAAVVIPATQRYVQPGALRTDTRNIAVGGAQSVAARFDMGCGTLSIRGGANDLMDATFTYNIPSWKPEVVYAVSGGRGRLAVKQPSLHGSVRGHVENRWAVRLGGGVPIDLDIDSGVGKTTLDLDGVDLKSIKVNSGSGGSETRLTGSYPSLTKVDVDSGVGGVSLALVGRYPALKRVDINGGTGSLKADLTGEWKQDAQVRIDSGVGATSVRLPKDVGVRVEVDTGIGKITGSGMRMAGEKVYVNDAYGTSKVTLNVIVHTGTGSISLDLEK